MKKVIPCLLILAASCNSKNQQMTSLLNRQKDLKDSINISFAISKDFEKSYQTEIDSVKKQQLLDSEILYNTLSFSYELKKRLIDYSIDSLSKMK